MKKKIYLMRPTIDEKEINAIKNVFKSKFLTEGKITAKFESVISNYVKSKILMTRHFQKPGKISFEKLRTLCLYLYSGQLEPPYTSETIWNSRQRISRLTRQPLSVVNAILRGDDDLANSALVKK